MCPKCESLRTMRLNSEQKYCNDCNEIFQDKDTTSKK
jgi:ribosomal protein L37AE/L43A